MKKLEKILKDLKTSKHINFYGSSALYKYLIQSIKHTLDKEINYVDTDQVVFEKAFNIIVCDSTRHFHNLLEESSQRANLVVLGEQVVSHIYKHNPELYGNYENRMIEEISALVEHKEWIQLFQTHLLFDLAWEMFQDKKMLKIEGEKKDKDNRVYCFWPWFNFYARGNILEWCCGYTYDNDPQDTWDDKNEVLNLQKVFNGIAFQKAREHFSLQENEGNCRHCHNFFFAENMPYIFKFQNLSIKQQENFENVLYSYWEKDLNVNATPLRYMLVTTFKCNFSCIMCNQEQYNKLPFKLKEEDILSNLDALQKAFEIILLGGEFFVSSNAKKILDIFITNDFSHTNFVFITNGSYLDRYFGQLLKIDKATFNISIDAIGKQFELIRKKSSWIQVEKNVHALLKLSKQYHKSWDIRIHTIIMKSSISGLIDLVKWCVNYNLAIGIIKYEYNSFNHEDEDVFTHPELLKDIPNWREQMQKSIALLKEVGRVSSCNALEKLYNELDRKEYIDTKY